LSDEQTLYDRGGRQSSDAGKFGQHVLPGAGPGCAALSGVCVPAGQMSFILLEGSRLRYL